MLQARLAKRSGDPPAAAEGETVLHLGPTLSLVRTGSGVELSCRSCGSSFGPLEEWKRRALTVTESVEDANPNIDAPQVYVDDPILFHTYHCGGCGRSVDSEVTVGADGPFEDIAIS